MVLVVENSLLKTLAEKACHLALESGTIRGLVALILDCMA